MKILRSAGDSDRHGLVTQQAQKTPHILQTLSVLSSKMALKSDETSIRLMKLYMPKILDTHLPLATVGDGSCLFMAVSILLYGSDVNHKLLRLLCVHEIIINRNFYDVTSDKRSDSLKQSDYLVIPPFEKVVEEVLQLDAANKGFTGVVGILALSSVIGKPIAMVFPMPADDVKFSAYNQILVGRDIDRQKTPITVMWTTMFNFGTKEISYEAVSNTTMNHIVPLWNIRLLSISSPTSTTRPNSPDTRQSASSTTPLESLPRE